MTAFVLPQQPMTVATAGAGRATSLTPSNPAVALVALYVALMPLVAGIPRGTPVPLLRPSELLLLIAGGAAAATAIGPAIDGARWRLRIGPVEWSMLGLVITGSVIPVLWVIARTGTIGGGDTLAAFPFVKYAALFLLVRLSVRTIDDVLFVRRAVITSGLVIAGLAVAQALGVGPIIDVLGQFFVSNAEDVVDGGRATTTIGSSIATGAYLSLSAATSLSAALSAALNSTSDNIGTICRWALITAALVVGALASGQAGTIVALAVALIVVAIGHRRLGAVTATAVPVGLLAMLALWPVVAARLADVDRGTGLPSSWLVRWNNVSTLYFPDLADWGWVLGVGPDTTRTPPDVWRQIVYLESGYLWLLWVGGIPLLIAAGYFLWTAWRQIGSTTAVTGDHDRAWLAMRVTARAAVAMMVALTIIDPHLTLRASADLFYVLVAVGLTGHGLARRAPSTVDGWRDRLGASLTIDSTDRMVIADVPVEARPAIDSPAGDAPEASLLLAVTRSGRTVASTRLDLNRRRQQLHGQLANPISSTDPHAAALTWRSIALCATSLRLASLTDATGDRFDRPDIRRAGRLADQLCAYDRNAAGKAVDRLTIEDQTTPWRQQTSGYPAVRLETDMTIPRWKRASDVVLGAVALVLAAPVMATAALLVRRSGAGPVIYRQLRIGSGGLPFQINKFRTMYLGNDDSAMREQNRRELRGESGAAKEAGDARITPIGRHLRRLSLDELPQLVNVLRGEMSLVGPRPSLLWEVELFEPTYRKRLRARPGLTGLWQVSGRADVSMSEMLILDLDYLERIGPTVDLHCLVGTATSVLSGRGAR